VAADENVHLATKTSSPDMLLDLSALATLKVDQRLLELCCYMDDWHHVSRFRARFSQRSPWWLSLGQKSAERSLGVTGVRAPAEG
jgi:hypothetical protein